MAESKSPRKDSVTIVLPKERDFAPRSALASNEDLSGPKDDDHNDQHDSSDTDTTATNSSDEFDWNEGEDDNVLTVDKSRSAKRGRALYLAFMKLARPLRVLLLGILGTGIFLAPFLVFRLRFNASPARFQVHVWSLWLTITWVAGVATYLVVDAIPRLVVWTVVLFRGQVERLKIQVEVSHTTPIYLHHS
jgi:hypothetical protein